jgi:hypothetical protein
MNCQSLTQIILTLHIEALETWELSRVGRGPLRSTLACLTSLRLRSYQPAREGLDIVALISDLLSPHPRLQNVTFQGS